MGIRLTQRTGEPANLVIRGARLLDPDAGIDETRDLVVRDGRIGGDPGGLEVVDGAGLLATPGLVDPHVHLRTPGREDTEDIATGTRAAAAGGFVAILAMPNTTPSTDSPAVLGALIEKAEQDAEIALGFLPAITVGQDGRELTEQGELAGLGAAGFSDDGWPVANAAVMRRALQYQKMTGLPLVLHEEDPDLSGNGCAHEGAVATRLGLPGIPSISESVAVARDALLAEYEGGRIHICHVSARETVTEVRRAKERGVRITAEVTPHHLLLTDAELESLDPARHKMNPPLRAEADRQALIAALIDGTLDCIATDHAPHALNEKEEPFESAPFGVTGLETAFAACYTGLVETGQLPLELLVRRMSGDPARIFGLPVPTLAEGSPANLALIDTGSDWQVAPDDFQSKSTNSAFTGETLRGRVQLTIAGGRVAWRR
jgi:dihydroorotase